MTQEQFERFVDYLDNEEQPVSVDDAVAYLDQNIAGKIYEYQEPYWSDEKKYWWLDNGVYFLWTQSGEDAQDKSLDFGHIDSLKRYTLVSQLENDRISLPNGDRDYYSNLYEELAGDELTFASKQACKGITREVSAYLIVPEHLKQKPEVLNTVFESLTREICELVDHFESEMGVSGYLAEYLDRAAKLGLDALGIDLEQNALDALIRHDTYFKERVESFVQEYEAVSDLMAQPLPGDDQIADYVQLGQEMKRALKGLCQMTSQISEHAEDLTDQVVCWRPFELDNSWSLLDKYHEEFLGEREPAMENVMQVHAAAEKMVDHLITLERYQHTRHPALQTLFDRFDSVDGVKKRYAQLQQELERDTPYYLKAKKRLHHPLGKKPAGPAR